jgi:N-acetylmuramoyl-L-alanine amidase
MKDGSHLYVIKYTTGIPAVLVECGFMDNLREARLLDSEAYRKECALELAKGVCEAYGVKYVPYVAPKPVAPKPAPKPVAKPTPSKEVYRVQVGAFGDRKNAEALVSKLKKDGYDAVIK